ncbi:MAG: carbamate kinase [Lachnoclostridium edouardi]|uniref:carbamate kinase n=1 Tax=Lachnoclostridium edouardi TaxID=1926283 RepID=UPI0026DD4201|nr:carbamate kinase [Lachnoclostridium edouardi]MDO4277270.1 carbamate kinase [Lachnoclostridium edouardi]
MAKKRLVMALGHDALGTNLPEQKAAVAKTAKLIADFIQNGWQVAVVHSNAPQLGMIHTAMNEFGMQHEGYTPAPMSVCSAMSQGYIGYDLQNGIRAELIKRGIYKPVSTILTQVTVDPYDEASYTPVKKIGRVMTAAEAAEEEAKGNYVAEVPGKGFCRMVAAPRPVAIVEIDAIKALLDNDQLVIACGGGGIPVMEQGSNLKGASAVIEKDLAGALLAKEVDADVLMILTNVDHVSLNYGKSNEAPISSMTVSQAHTYKKDGQFGVGTMQPKICAAIDFIEAGKGRSAIITTQAMAREALEGKAGTIITE